MYLLSTDLIVIWPGVHSIGDLDNILKFLPGGYGEDQACGDRQNPKGHMPNLTLLTNVLGISIFV